MTGTALATRRTDGALAVPAAAEPAQVVWTQERIQTLRSTLAKDCTPAQFELALSFCQRTGLDPFLRQVHIVVRQGQMTLQIGIDGHRAIALRSGVYAGEDGPLYCGEDGAYTDTWVGAEPPVAAKCTIWRHDYDRPFVAVVLYREFSGIGGPLWKSAPIHMLGIRAASHAYRKAFQQELASHGRIARAMGVGLESAADPAQELGADQPPPPSVLAAPSRAAPQARVIEATARPAGSTKPAQGAPSVQARLINRRNRMQALVKRLRELGEAVPAPPVSVSQARLDQLDAYGKQLKALVDAAEARVQAEAEEAGEAGWEPDRGGPFEDEAPEAGAEGAGDSSGGGADTLDSYRQQYETLRSECQALGLDPPELSGEMDANAVADLFLHWTEQKAAAEDALRANLAGKAALPAQSRPRR